MQEPPAEATTRLPTWFAAGFAVAAFLIATQATAVGGLSGLLLVGEDSNLRPFIGSLIDDVELAPRGGHDGQIYFAIAHDLSGDTVAELIENPGIRYRRPVLPLLTSFGGLLRGPAVLWSTAFWIAMGFGFSAVAFRQLLAHWALSPRWMAALFAYPGFWMATRLFTPDMIALALALGGLVLHLRKKHWTAIGLFTLAALTKEAFVVIALAAGAWAFFERRRWLGVLTAFIPASLFAGYATAVIARFDAPAVDGNFGLPFAGVWNARPDWAFTTPSDRAYIYLTIGVLVLSVLVAFRTRDNLLRWLIIPWPLIGIISSEWIWRIGNGTLRSFAPVVLFVALAVGHEWRSRQASSNSLRNLPV
jgi:hypothetical protein